MKTLAMTAALMALTMESAAAMSALTPTDAPTDTQPATAAATPDAAAVRAGFDRAGWVAAAGKPEASGQRAALVDAAIAQVPAGTSRDDVRARLGEPDRDFADAWAYFAGETLLGGEYGALLVEFDANGRVTAARQVSSETWN